MHYAPARVAALQAQHQLAVGVGVESNAARDQLTQAVGGLFAEQLGAAACGRAAARLDRVLKVQLGAVVGGDRRGQSALSPEARRLGHRRTRHQHDICVLLGGDERRVQAGGSGADHRDIEAGAVGCARLGHRGVRYLEA